MSCSNRFGVFSVGFRDEMKYKWLPQTFVDPFRLFIQQIPIK